MIKNIEMLEGIEFELPWEDVEKYIIEEICLSKYFDEDWVTLEGVKVRVRYSWDKDEECNYFLKEAEIMEVKKYD